ncbi:MAG: hypothetical protein IJC18_05725, partial [Clostridia bacterium]|nr:hypothetical protein [Clostridia bacterium]
MRKRLVAVFSLMLIIAGVLIARILMICTQADYVQAAGTQSVYNLTVNTTRGTIYDCKLRPLAGGRAQYKAIIAPSQDTIAHLTKLLEPSELLSMQSGLTGRHPFIAVVEDGGIEGEGVTVLKTQARYSGNTIASHTLGYLDGAGRGAAGIERCFDEYLDSVSGSVTAIYTIDATGRSIDGLPPEIIDTTDLSRAGVALTLDIDIQQ